MNYHEHLKEMKTPVPEKPAAFTKSVASIIASGQPILLPAAHPGHGRLGRRIHRGDRQGRPPHPGGEGARPRRRLHHRQRRLGARLGGADLLLDRHHGPIHAWEHNLLGKMMPTFCPMGPCIATKDEVPDPDDVKIVTRLNGQVMQDANTDDLVFSVAKLIEYYSQFYRFLPGDCITTGSPSGVGFGRNPKVFMKAGDTIEVEVNGIGVLRTRSRSS